MIDELKKAFMHSWTGGASGAPNRFHGPGALITSSLPICLIITNGQGSK